MRSLVAVFALLLSLPAIAAIPEKKASAENKQFRRWLVHYLKNDPDDDDLANMTYGYALLDLNGDGRNEAVVWAKDSNLCGTSGCGFLVFVHDRSGWRLFADGPTTRPPIKVLPTRTHGWQDLSSLQYGGGVEHPFEAWDRFEGKSGYNWSRAAPKVPKNVHGRIIIREASIPLFPEKCRKVIEAPSTFGPLPVSSKKPGSC